MKLKSLSAVIMLLAVSAIFAQTPVKFKQGILISSAGQSADMKMISLMFKKMKIDAKENSTAAASDLNGIQTLILVPGFSSKGLGAAGISQEQELNRVKELVSAAEKKNIKIICVHVGGNARRKGQSDAFNRAAAEASNAIIVVKQGDEDKFFTNIAGSKKIPIRYADKIADISTPLGEFFK